MNYRLKYEGSQRMLAKAMAQLSEQAAAIERARDGVWKAYKGAARMVSLLPPHLNLVDLANDFDKLARDHRAAIRAERRRAK